ncbi:MAG: hypothetical protein QM820_64165 [Minicystis sp.]
MLDASEAAARLDRMAKARTASLAKGRAARVEVCFRCGGDGLGRRDRGECSVCHGRGVRVVEPVGGWLSASTEELAAAVNQAVSALRGARQARAREALGALIATIGPLAPPRAYGELRRGSVAGPPPGRSEAERA